MDTQLTPINRIPFRLLKPALYTLRATAFVCVSVKGDKDMLTAKTIAAKEYTEKLDKPARLQLLTYIGIWYKLCQEWRDVFAGEKLGAHIENVLHECAWVGEMLAVMEREQV